MSKRATIKPGDYRALAELEGVPGIHPETTQRKAARLLVEHLTVKILEKHGPPPGWTAEEYLTKSKK